MRPVTFIATNLPEAARAFYADTLGLRLVEDTPFAMVFDNHGVPLRLTPAPPFTPHGFTVLGWQVDNIEAEVDQLTSRGARFSRFPQLVQDERGIWTAPGGAKVAWFADPDGNILSLSQH